MTRCEVGTDEDEADPEGALVPCRRDLPQLGGCEHVVLLEDIPLQLAQLGRSSRVLPLTQRDLKLLLAFDQLLERALSDLHRTSLWVAARLLPACSFPT